MTTTAPLVLFERRGPAVIATLNDPERLNPLSAAMLALLAEELALMEQDGSARALIVTGAGRGFSSGLNMRTMRTMERTRHRLGWPRPRPDLAAPVFFRNTPIPVIAAINGVAAGAGMSLALAADIRIMSDRARLFPAFLKRGVMPDMGLPHTLTRMVGTQRALELLWAAEPIEPTVALRLRLVSQVVQHEQLMTVALALAERIAKGPLVAMAYTKRAVYLAEAGDLEKGLEWNTLAQRICRTTEDSEEGIRAFLEKREPVFKGR